MKNMLKFPFGQLLTIIGVIFVVNSLSGIDYTILYKETAPKVVLLAPYERPQLSVKLHIGAQIIVFTKKFPWGCKYKSGSGVFVREDGVILTAAHVVKGTSILKVTTQDGMNFRAGVIATDEKLDLALIKIVPNTPFLFKWARIGKERPSGWPVYALGNPLGLPWLITNGIISGYKNSWLISDTVINPGSSGGGLFDATNGRLQGITIATISPGMSAGFAGHSITVRPKDVIRFLERNMPLCG